MANLKPRLSYFDAYEPFGDKPPVKARDHIVWGTRGMATDRKPMKGKFTPKSYKVRRVGYAENQSSDTYTLMKLGTHRALFSRDVKFEKPKLLSKPSH